MDYKLYNKDCLEGMEEIPDGSVDMVLTDLPYATTDFLMDKKIDLPTFWREIDRVTKRNAAIVLFAQMNTSKIGKLPFAAELIATSSIPFRYEWIWHKALPVGFLNARKMHMRIHENILVFYRALPTYNPQWFWSKPYKVKSNSKPTENYRQHKRDAHDSDGRRYPVDVLKFNQPIACNEETWHPQQKPLALLEYLIRTYTVEGEIVLDATMGSGSTCVAAYNTKRQFIGFELNEEYYQIALKRMQATFAEESRNLFSRWRNELVEQSENQSSYFAARVE